MVNTKRKNSNLVSQKKSKSENINLILNAKHSSMLQFSLLTEIFELFHRYFSKSLKDFFNLDAIVNIAENRDIAFAEFIEDIKSPSMISVLELDTPYHTGKSLVILENQFIYTLLDILLGGNEYKFDLQVQKRPFTKIEKGIIEDFIKVMVDSINRSFEEVSDIQFKFKSIESSPNSVLITNSEEQCKLLNININPTNKTPGFAKFLIPYSTLIPYKSILSNTSLKSRDLREKEIWSQYFENIVSSLRVNVCVEHNEKVFRIRDLSDLEIGKTIILNRINEQSWDVVINRFKVSECKIGKINNKVAVEILGQIDASKFLE